MDVLCVMAQADERGRVRATVRELCVLARCQISDLVLFVSETLRLQIAEISIDCSEHGMERLGCVAQCPDAALFVENRKMMREHRVAEQTAERQKRYKARAGKVRPIRPPAPKPTVVPAPVPAPASPPALELEPEVNPQLSLVPSETPISASEFADTWNALADELGLSKISGLLGDRKTKLLRRLKEHPELSFWKTVFANIRTSDYLRGGKNGWSCTFDFVVKSSTTCVKIFEGQYANKPPQQRSSLAR